MYLALQYYNRMLKDELLETYKQLDGMRPPIWLDLELIIDYYPKQLQELSDGEVFEFVIDKNKYEGYFCIRKNERTYIYTFSTDLSKKTLTILYNIFKNDTNTNLKTAILSKLLGNKED